LHAFFLKRDEQHASRAPVAYLLSWPHIHAEFQIQFFFALKLFGIIKGGVAKPKKQALRAQVETALNAEIVRPCSKGILSQYVYFEVSPLSFQ
jgi:hypothetical protein